MTVQGLRIVPTSVLADPGQRRDERCHSSRLTLKAVQIYIISFARGCSRDTVEKSQWQESDTVLRRRVEDVTSVDVGVDIEGAR